MTRTAGCAFRMPARTSRRFCRTVATGVPRKPSLAPLSTTTTSKFPRRSQSRRRRRPAVVSPLTPAFTTSNGRCAASIFSRISCGYALSGSRPRPAVRLVPMKRTVCVSVPVAATACDVLCRESGRSDVLAFDTVSATTLSSARVLLHAAESARLVAATSDVVQRPTSVVIVMLVARHLTKQYRSGEHELTVLRDVNFSLPQGAFVAIVGPSGSGKTTRLGLLAGLDTPSSGTVLLDDQDFSAMDEDARARLRGEKVGFVFQSFQLIPTLTALENVQVPLELRGDSGADVRARELLRRVGLGDRLHHFPTQLSGGEQQRVAIARAFSNAPRILFADEPTGNLDSHQGSRIFELLEALNRESNSTVVLVTHDASLAARAQRIIRLSDGRVVSDTQTEQAA